MSVKVTIQLTIPCEGPAGEDWSEEICTESEYTELPNVGDIVVFEHDEYHSAEVRKRVLYPFEEGKVSALLDCVPF